MGAEATKYKQMYEERVEEMRQELVRQEQEYQQAAEALRLAHAAQLERQMYDQEQLLSEVHRLREQLTEVRTLSQRLIMYCYLTNVSNFQNNLTLWMYSNFNI